MNEPQFGVFLSPHSGNAAAAVESAVAAEAAGFDYASVQDHPYQGAFLDPLLLIGWLAAATSRLRFMTNVVNLPPRPPAMLAKSAATLDLLSGGRFTLGIGGGRWWDRITGLGGPAWSPGQAVTAVDEAISVLQAMWTAPEPVSFDGKVYTVRAEPGPRPQRPLPVWLGAAGPRMLGLLGRRSDGWISPIMSDYADKAAAQDAIDRAAAAAGRSPGDIRRVIQLTGEVSSTAGARSRPLTGPNSAPLSTTPGHWAAIIAGFLTEQRFDTVNFIPARESAEQVRRFGTEVIPLARELARH